MSISDALRAQEAGDAPASWWGRHGGGLYSPAGEDWDNVLAVLYAERSASRIRHNSYESPTGTVLAVWLEMPSALQFLLGGIVIAPFEIALSPLWLASAAARDASVDAADLVQAAKDIAQARELGFQSAEVGTGYILGRPLHVDQIGYDSAWLRSSDCGLVRQRDEHP